MKDKTYPSFYESVGGNRYLYLNNKNYYCFSRLMWEVADDADTEEHEADTNITREYLQNTYGVVESKEHAEFIIELGKNVNAKISTSWKRGKCFNFCTNLDDGFLLDFYDEELASDSDERKITIPLPPKEPLKNAGDNLILGCEDSKCDEWIPQVGDDVCYKNSGNVKGIVLAIDGGVVWVKDKHGGYSILQIENLVKPKTPEEELRDEITELVWKANGLWTDTKAVQQVSVQEFVATKIIDKYNITKKPQ